MLYTESTKYALGTRRVNEAFEIAKSARTEPEKLASKFILVHFINQERARWLKAHGYSVTEIAEELNVQEEVVIRHLV